MIYEKMKIEAHQHGISVIEKPFQSQAKGLIKGNRIGINSAIGTMTEKGCILAEELGHYHTTAGDILDQSTIPNRKQEHRAREWAYNHLIPLHKIIDAHKAKISGRHDVAEFFGVTEEFLQATIDRFIDKYGLHIKVDKRYMIVLDPLAVVEIFPE